jgi:hypothetical protein
MVAKKVFVNCYNFNPFTYDKKVISRYLINLFAAGAGAGAAIRNFGSAESKPKEIFSTPQH